MFSGKLRKVFREEVRKELARRYDVLHAQLKMAGKRRLNRELNPVFAQLLLESAWHFDVRALSVHPKQRPPALLPFAEEILGAKSVLR